MSEMVNNFVEQIQGYFSQLRDLENIQFERLQELCLSTLEKVLKGEVNDDFPDDLRDVKNIYPNEIASTVNDRLICPLHIDFKYFYEYMCLMQ